MDEHEKAGADRAVDLLAQLKQVQAENKSLRSQVEIDMQCLEMSGKERRDTEAENKQLMAERKDIDRTVNAVMDENKRLIGLWEKLKKWANDEDETDGLDIGDFIDQINYLANQALTGE